MSTDVIAPVIPLFDVTTTPRAVTVEDYARIATGLVAEARKRNMDPVVLAGAMVAVVGATEEPAEEEPEAGSDQTPTYDRGFRGSKYVEGRDVTDIAKDIRRDITAARRSGELDLPAAAKVSVRIDRYSMGRSIDITVKGLTDAQLWVAPGTPADYAADYPHNGGRSPLRKAATSVLNGILDSYNRNNSDIMTDYYDVAFFSNVRFSER